MLPFKYVFFLLVLSVLVFAGCSKDKSNPIDTGDNNSPTNPGNGTEANVEVLINGTKYIANTGGSYYIPSEGLTYAAFWNGNLNDSLTVTVVFPGKELSTYSWDGENCGVYMVKGTGSKTKAYVSDATGTTIITKYGNVNQQIEGTFSGTLYDVQTEAAIEVFGSFLLNRMPDQND